MRGSGRSNVLAPRSLVGTATLDADADADAAVADLLAPKPPETQKRYQNTQIIS
jgi:hypothetical protein